MYSYREKNLIVVLLALVIALMPASVAGQRPESADSILAIVMLGAETPSMSGQGLVQQLFLHPSQFGPGVRDAVAVGLEEIVRQNVGTREFRQSVVVELANAGSRDSDDPMPGAAAQLVALHDETDDPVIKLVIVGMLAQAADAETAADFLTKVAKRDGPAAARAIVALEQLGAPGRSALVRLHRDSTVRDPDAQTTLKASARRDFRPKRGSLEN